MEKTKPTSALTIIGRCLCSGSSDLDLREHHLSNSSSSPILCNVWWIMAYVPSSVFHYIYSLSSIICPRLPIHYGNDSLLLWVATDAVMKDVLALLAVIIMQKKQQYLVNLVQYNINRRPILTFMYWEGRNVIMSLFQENTLILDILCLKCLKWKVKLKNELLGLFLNRQNVI